MAPVSNVMRRASIASEALVEKLEERAKEGKPMEDLAALSVPTSSAKKGSVESYVRYLVSAGLCPLSVGFALQKGRVFEPRVIQDVFLLRDFTMMSFFLGAVGASQLIFGLLDSIPADSKSPLLRYFGAHFKRIKEQYGTSRYSQRGTTSAAAGAAMLGTAMALSGACPGTAWVAAASGVPGSEAVIAGGLVGVSLFTAAERKVLPKFFEASKASEVSLDKAVGTGYNKMALVSSAAMIAAAVAFNKLTPNSQPHFPVPPITGILSALRAPAWNPVLAGALMGATQLPMVLFGDTFLGTSTPFVSLLAPFGWLFRRLGLTDDKSEVSKFQPVISAKTVLSGWGFLAMLASGAYLSAKLGGTRHLVGGLVGSGAGAPSIVLSSKHPLLQPVLAGALLWFGARTALGCTTGHGISGFALLLTNSVIATAAMFGSGIATAQILKYLA